jgi:hypothetical protein
MPIAMIEGLVISLLALGAVANASPITWQVHPDSSCPKIGDLQAAYATLGQTPAPRGAMDLPVTVEIDSSTTYLQIHLSIPELQFTETRTVEVGDSPCREVAQTVAILVHTWVAHAPSPPAETMTPTPTVPAIDTQAALTVRSTPTEVARVQGQPTHASSSMGLALRTGFGLVVSSSSSATPAVPVSVELRLSREVGLGLFASWIGNLSVDDAPYGSVVVERQLIGATVSLAMPGSGQWGLRGLSGDLLGGFVLWHGNAQSYAYPVTSSQDLFEPGFTAAARIDQALGGPLFLEAQVSAVALVRSLSLQVSRPGALPATVAELPWFTLAFGLGLGVNIL